MTARADRLTGRTATVGPHRLHVRAGGPNHPCRPPALLVPGLVSSSRYLEPLGVELARDRLVVAPDLPGTGRSPRAAHPLPLDELAGLLCRLARDTTGPAVVIANSFGCLVAIELARQAPELVHRLVLTSPVLAPRARSLPALVARFVRAMRHETPRYLSVVLRDALRASLLKGWADLTVLLEDPVLERAAGLAVPTLVVRGRRDDLVPEAFARRLAARIPDGRYHEINCTHALPFAAPQALAAMIREPAGSD